MNTRITIKLFSFFLTLMSITFVSKAQFLEASNNEPKTRNPIQVEYFNKNLLLYVTSDFTLISNDGGKNFNLLNGGLSSSSQFVNDSTIINLAGSILRITTNKGINWEKKYLISNNQDTNKLNLRDLNIFNDGHGFVTGFSTISKPQVFITEDFGLTWYEADTLKNNFSLINKRKFSYVTNYKLYSFEKVAFKLRDGYDSLIIKYINYGDSALEIDLNKHGIKEPISSYAFQSEDTAIFLTSKATSGKNQIIYLTTDGCKTFTKLNSHTAEFISIEYAQPSKLKKGFFIGSLQNGGTAYSYDFGQSWINNFDPYKLITLDFYDAETGIASEINDNNLNSKIFYFTELTNSINQANLINPISIYPNPATNTLNLNISEDFGYSIINLQGQVMQREEIKNASNSIDISKLETGVYIINLNTTTGNYYSKFIKIEN